MGNNETIENTFAEKYAAFQLWVNEHPTANDPTSCPDYKAIIDLGPKIVPILIRRLQADKSEFLLTSALLMITKVRIPKERWPQEGYGSAQAAVDVYQSWWTVDRKQTPERYRTLTARWDELKTSDKIERSFSGLPLLWYDQTGYDQQSATLMVLPRQRITEIGQTYLSIKDMGIDVLPLIASDLEKGKYDFLPIFIELTHCNIDETPQVAVRVKNILTWWKAHKEEWTIPEKY